DVLKSALNPSRFGYMRRILTEDLGHDPKRLRILDVGCGGGLLAEEFARLGCAVTGVDPSTDSLEVARARERGTRLDLPARSPRPNKTATFRR
ncbi:MAG TPA: methyltransferase domain-containing protein, partial [Gaiellaceae bacterium]|nr:methyltransferase domain-containing protein [Gaiellaceae bacterium]